MMYLETPPRLIATQIFSAMPAEFRRNVRSDWADANRPGAPTDSFIEGPSFDADGNPTRDGKEAAKGGVSSFGGHKGYGLAFAVQALGLLAGAMLPRGRAQDYGFLFFVVDPGAMLPGGEVDPFAAQMAALVKAIQATPRRDGVAEIRIPSQRAFRERDRRRAEGILVDQAVIDALKAL